MSTAPHGFLRVGAACPRVWVADPERNAGEILRLVEAARAQGTQLLVGGTVGKNLYWRLQAANGNPIFFRDTVLFST